MKISAITHVFNEHLMLPTWIEWHKDIFDNVTIINDGGAERFEHLLPEGWKIIPTRRSNFDCFQLDAEVMEVEAAMKAEFNHDWLITLNVTEWVFEPLLREKLGTFQAASNYSAFGMNSIVLVDNDFSHFNSHSGSTQTPNPLLHTWGFIDNYHAVRRPRYIHNQSHGHYQLGRHAVNIPSAPSGMLLLYWSHAPWPACIERKLQIQTQIPQIHKDMKLGFEHITSKEGLNQRRLELLEMSDNLLKDERYKERYDQYYPSI
jgi:hypothetical protein